MRLLQQFRVKEVKLVSQNWEECSLVPDAVRGWESSKKVLVKENVEWRSVTNLKTYNFFINKVRGLIFDGKSLRSLF